MSNKMSKWVNMIIITFFAFILAGCSENWQQTGQIEDSNKQAQSQMVIHHENIMYGYSESLEIKNTKNEDINGDGVIDNIELTIRPTKAVSIHDGELKINDSKINLRLENPSTDINIIDINPADQYKEIDIYQDGPSADPESRLFIYNGHEIIEIGKIDSFFYMINENAQVIPDYNLISYFEPSILLGYATLDENHKLQYVGNDLENYFNKEYKFTKKDEPDGWGIFDSYDAYRYSDAYIAKIKDGDVVTILDIKIDKGIFYRVRFGEHEGWLIPY